MSQVAESEMLAGCRRGDAHAWDELFERHYDAVGRFVFQLSSAFTREDAEEVTQEVFLAAIKNIQGFHGNSQVQTWLFRIAANKARDYIERQRAAKRGGGRVPISLQAEDPETGLSVDPPSRAPGPDACLINSERYSILGQALDTLGEPCREIIELRYLGDLSYEEISRALDLNEKTVSSRLSKCLDRLEEAGRAILSREKSPVFPSNQ
jgi:RNA polymerase sigma-70 factor (ECF subfamily)